MSTFDLCSNFSIHNCNDIKYSRIFSKEQIVRASPTIKIVELLNKIYSGEKSNNEIRKLVVDGQVSIGTFRPRNPLIKLSDILAKDVMAVMEKDKIIGLYINDLVSEESLKPNSVGEKNV